MDDNIKKSQYTKADEGKPRISLVPPEIMRVCSIVREYGVKKYKDPNSWALVEKQRYVDAMCRHILSYIEGEKIDPESKLPHIWHAACNMSFIIEMEKSNWEDIKKRIIDNSTRDGEY